MTAVFTPRMSWVNANTVSIDMSILAIKNADRLVTMDENRREISGGTVLVENNKIIFVGDNNEAEQWLKDQSTDVGNVIDASGTVVLPGLINCHHHLYQTLTRSVGTAQGLSLFDWLKTLYPVWGQMDAEAVYISAKLGANASMWTHCEISSIRYTRV